MTEILECGVMVIAEDTHHRAWIKECGSLVHDKWMAAQVSRHVKLGEAAINAGAHIGTLARPLIDAGATVLAFEPNKEAAECLAHNCPEATIFNLGLSDRVQNGAFHRKQNTGASYFRGQGPDLLVPLDQYRLHERHRITLLLADIEGYEVKMLRGARGTIEKAKPVMILEVNAMALYRAGDGPEELFRLVEAYDYSWSILQPDITDIEAPQYDILCLPK